MSLYVGMCSVEISYYVLVVAVLKVDVLVSSQVSSSYPVDVCYMD